MLAQVQAASKQNGSHIRKHYAVEMLLSGGRRPAVAGRNVASAPRQRSDVPGLSSSGLGLDFLNSVAQPPELWAQR
jgi:hypothetical protein